MKYFENLHKFKTWFGDRYFDDEAAYVKGTDQIVLISTKYAEESLNIAAGQNVDQSNLAVIVEDVVKLETKLIQQQEDGLVMEKLKLGDTTQLTYWVKRQIMIEDVLYFLIEQSMNGEFTLKNILKVKLPIKKISSTFEVKFTEIEKSILYLLANGFILSEVADVMCVADSTIRTHINRNIIPKFSDLGYQVTGREEVVQIAEKMQFHKTIPVMLLNFIKPKTLLLKRM